VGLEEIEKSPLALFSVGRRSLTRRYWVTLTRATKPPSFFQPRPAGAAALHLHHLTPNPALFANINHAVCERSFVHRALVEEIS
jgi:hypothetical protein